MKEETQPQPSIAELWGEFQKLLRVGKRNPLYWSKHWDKRNLRAQLLERCKPWFGWLDDGSIYVEVHHPPRNPTPAQLREFEAVYGFIAWELEQRAKGNETKPTA